MKKERAEYIEILRELGGDPAGRRRALEYVRDSDCYIYGKPAPFSFVPVFYDKEELGYLRNVCSTIHDILGKVIMHYVEEPEYRKLFGFPKEVEELILLPCNYAEPLPMARFDFFLDEEDLTYKFCEFNADGTAAMSRTLIGCEAVEQTETFRRFAANHQVRQFELFDSWVKEFLETYRSDANAVEQPNVLITDFTENVTMSDVTRYIAAFERAGVGVRYVDLRKLAFDGEHLYDPEDGMVFHAVYRRVVTSDIARELAACRPLIDAVAAEKVCLIGHFRTTVIHAKLVNVALLDEQTRSILSPEEWGFVQEHILPTYRFRSDEARVTPKMLLANKDKWILKPQDDYDSHGVFAGVDMDQTEWAQKVAECLDNSYVAMEFYEPSRAEIALPYEEPDPADPVALVNWRSMTGTFSFNGKLYGFFNRMGAEGVVSESHGGVSIPAYEIL